MSQNNKTIGGGAEHPLPSNRNRVNVNLMTDLNFAGLQKRKRRTVRKILRKEKMFKIM